MNILRPAADNSAKRSLTEASGAAPQAQGLPPAVPRLSAYEQQEAGQTAGEFHLGSDNTRRYALLQRFAYNLRASPQNDHPQRRQSLEIRHEQLADLVQDLLKTSRSLHDTLDRFAQAEKSYSTAVQGTRSESGWWTRLFPDAMLGKQLASRAQEVRRLEQTVADVARQLDQQGRAVDKVLFAATSVRWLQRPMPPPSDSGLKHIPFF